MSEKQISENIKFKNLYERGIWKINLNQVVDAYDFLYKQKKSGWTFELDLRTNKENW